MSTMRWTSTTVMLLAALLASWPLLAADNEATSSLPAWPAALDPNCSSNCEDTTRQPHEITFVSRIGFPVGSALLTKPAKAELLRLLVELESFAVVSRIEIIGHADPTGPEDFNIWLSQRRAERVLDHFLQSGVDPRMASTSGLGSSDPLVGAIDESEHRRTEIRITVRPFL